MNFAHHDFKLDERGPGAGSSSFSSASAFSANRRTTIQQWSGRLLQTNQWSRPSLASSGALLSPLPVAMSRAALARAAGLAAGRVASSSASPASFARVSSGSGLGGSSLVASPSIVGPGLRWASSLPRDALPGSSRSLFELAAREALAPRRLPRAPRARAPRPGAVARGGRVAREGAAGAAARPARSRDPGRRLPDVFDPLRRVRRGAPGAAAFARRHATTPRSSPARSPPSASGTRCWSPRPLARDPSATADPTREVASLAPARARDPRGAIDPPEEPRGPGPRPPPRDAPPRAPRGPARGPRRAHHQPEPPRVRLRRRRVDARRATPIALVAERSVLSGTRNPPPSSPRPPRGVGASRVRVDAPRGTPRVPRRRREAQRRRRRVGAENARPPRDGPPRRRRPSPRRA